MRNFRFLAAVAMLAPALYGTSAAAQTSSSDKLTWHGYLTQGYGVSSPVPILGLNRDPSGDYRAAALQLRYAIAPTDNFVVQAGTRSFGSSPYATTAGTVVVDWAFYQHQFAHTSLQVGRVPVPFGFLSELRDVGTLLPFYRAPATYYLESYRSLDGVKVTHYLSLPAGSLDVAAYAGGTDGRQITWLPNGQYVNTKLRFERLVGGDLTYNTPIEGLRLRGGIATLRSLDTATVQTAPAMQVAVLDGGMEGNFDRVMLRGESRRMKIGPNGRTYDNYLQTGLRATSKLWVNGQVNMTNVDNLTGAGRYEAQTADDRALGLAYNFQPNLVAKLEKHWAHGGVDAYVPAGTAPPFVSYAVASISVSF